MKLYDLHSTPFNFEAGAVLSIATSAALADFDDREIANGGVVYVESYRDYFQKIVESPAPAASPNLIVPTSTGDGGWYRLCIPSPSWQATTDWYIDSVAGDDENTGALNATLKTWAEFTRRVKVISGTVTVNIVSTTTEILVGTFTGSLATDSLVITGVPTALITTPGVFAIPVAATNSRGTITAAALADFTPYVGKIARVGTRVSPILKTNGANSAYTGFWVDKAGANGTPVDGNFEILSLPSVAAVQILTDGLAVQARYLRLATATVNGSSYINRQSLLGYVEGTAAIGAFFACEIYQRVSALSNINICGCVCTSSFAFLPAAQGGRITFICGGAIGDVIVNQSGAVAFQGFIIQTGKLAVGQLTSGGGPCRVETNSATLGLGVFDCPANAVEVYGQQVLACAALFGSGNLVGVAVTDGGHVMFDGSTPTIRGTANDLTVNAVTTLLPPPNQTTGVWAATASFAGANGAGWTAWAAAPFSRKLMAYTNGSSVCG